jgi:hypothetical protein
METLINELARPGATPVARPVESMVATLGVSLPHVACTERELPSEKVALAVKVSLALILMRSVAGVMDRPGSVGVGADGVVGPSPPFPPHAPTVVSSATTTRVLACIEPPWCWLVPATQ